MKWVGKAPGSMTQVSIPRMESFSAIGLGKAFDGEFRRVVRPEEGEGHSSDDARDHHQQTGALRSHRGQHRTVHSMNSEDVDIETLLPIGRGERFHESVRSDTGIVDHHVETADFVEGSCHSAVDAPVVGDVELHDARARVP